MTELYSFLKKVLKMPGMFKVSKVEDIEFIVLGYSDAIKNLESSKTVGDFFAELDKHVSKKYSFDGVYNWCKVFRFLSASDTHSLNLFEENLTELYERNIIRGM